jgi:hypothetical protein
LRRAVRCGRCASPLTGSWSTGRSKRYPYYHCPRQGCGTNVRKEQLENLLLHQLDSLTAKPEVLRLLGAVVEDAWSDRVRAAGSAVERLQAQARDLEARQDDG